MTTAAQAPPDADRPALTLDEVISERRNAQHVLGWTLPNDVSVIAADSHTRPVGTALLRLFTPDGPGYGFVTDGVPEHSVGVAESCRGRGVSRALPREMVIQDADRGYDYTSLSIELTNRAHRLYPYAGFTVETSGRDADTMAKG